MGFVCLEALDWLKVVELETGYMADLVINFFKLLFFEYE